MSRTTESQVKDLLEDPEASVSTAIATANVLVTRLVTGGSKDDSITLELIERWLSAHFYTIRNPQVSSESVLGASQSLLTGSVGTGLEATLYGQQALILDSTGSLANQAKGASTIDWVGTSPKTNNYKSGSI